MPYVKIKKDAHMNHRPPHIPWYIDDESDNVKEVFANAHFYGDYDISGKYLVIKQITIADIPIKVQREYYYISARDLTPISMMEYIKGNKTDTP